MCPTPVCGLTENKDLRPITRMQAGGTLMSGLDSTTCTMAACDRANIPVPLRQNLRRTSDREGKNTKFAVPSLLQCNFTAAPEYEISAI